MQADKLLKKPTWTNEFKCDDWDKLDEQLRDAFLKKFGIHQDEYDNFNGNMIEILKNIKEHVKINIIDPVSDELHQVYVDDCYFVKPYDRFYGLDNPEHALLRGDYECTVRTTMVYTISRKPENTQEIKIDKDIQEAKEEEESKEDEEEQEDDDEEEQEDDEEEHEEEEQEDEEEQEEEGDKDEESKNLKQSAFGFSHDIFACYTKIIHKSVVENHLLQDVPVLIKSILCNMSSSLHVPSLYSKLYFQMPSYCVSRTFKICPYEEYYINNRILAFKNEEIQIRSKFYQQSKKFRTNVTLKMTLCAKKFRPNMFWEEAPRFLVEIPHEKPKVMIPVTVLAMAFGWTSMEFVQAVKYMIHKKSNDPYEEQLNMYLHILESDKENCVTQKDAILRIGGCFAKTRNMKEEKDILSYISHNLHVEQLANLSDEKNLGYDLENFRKGEVLAQAATELICLSPLIHKYKPDILLNCKRSYVSKRVDTPGEKLAGLARKYITTFAQKAAFKLKSTIDKQQKIDLNIIFNRKNVKLTQSVKNGVWDCKTETSDSNQNKTQMMITGFCSDSNHMQTQKIMKFAIKKNSNPETLLTHPTQVGRIDPFLTPESDKCGIVRFKAMGCCISQSIELSNISFIILEVIRKNANQIGWVDAIYKKYPDDTNMFSVYDVYGGIIGWIKNADKLYEIFCNLRRKLILHRYFGMEIDTIRFKFFFNCDEGRLLRPLIICSEIPRLVYLLRGTMFKYLIDPVSYLLQNGFVEYLDAAEEYCGFVVVAHTLETVINSTISFTHMEIHGCFSLAMGVSKAFADCNQGPRRMLTGNMEKRSIGVKIHPDRGTTDSHSLWYGQDNLLSEPIDKSLGSRHDEPNGKNVMVMILSDEYNIEDCWKICKSSIELGMGISTKNHIFTTSLSANCIYIKPDHNCTGRASPEKYDHLNLNGLPIIGSILRYGDAVVGKIIEYKESNLKKYRCMSKFIPWFSEYRVEKVECLPTINPKTLRITLIQVNHPIIGNKYYLQHGQKGTCGDITAREDMPFICIGPNAGMTPDIVTNVASLMRVTSGLLLEMLIGKARALKPSLIEQYSNIFIGQIGIENKLKIARYIFKEFGLNYSGKDMVRSGDTGRLKNCEVFWGPAKVGVLKHMSRDKLRGRERGTTIDLTRQPPAGFMQNGGQKFGEMENWCVNSWGTTSIFRNMNYHSAEKFMILMCNRCHQPALGCMETNVFYCKICKKSDEVIRVVIPYISNLFNQETTTCGWAHKFMTQKCPEGTPDEMAIFHAHRLKMST